MAACALHRPGRRSLPPASIRPSTGCTRLGAAIARAGSAGAPDSSLAGQRGCGIPTLTRAILALGPLRGGEIRLGGEVFSTAGAGPDRRRGPRAGVGHVGGHARPGTGPDRRSYSVEPQLSFPTRSSSDLQPIAIKICNFVLFILKTANS